MLYNEIGNSIGIEVEAYGVGLALARQLASANGVTDRIINDGSIRHYSRTFLGFQNFELEEPDNLSILTSAGLVGSRMEMGCEIVTNILDTSERGWESGVIRILEFLRRMGETIALNTGVHIHTNASGLPVDVLHNLIHLWTSIEAGMYRLSCGPLGVFRGTQHMDSHYCRPLIPEGPLVVRDPRGILRPSFDVQCLLNATSVKDFAKAFMRSDSMADYHYHSPRYVGLNFHSLFRLGSIEFRTFNSSLVPSHIVTWVELVKSIIRKAMDKSTMRILPKNPYGTDSISLEYMIDLLEIVDQRVIYTLEDLWNMGEFPPPLAGWRFTHREEQRQGFDWGSIKKELIPPPVPEDVKVWASDSLINPNIVKQPGGMSLGLFLNSAKRYLRR